MEFHQILSSAELQMAPDGLYYVADDEGSYIESERHGAAVRLMARVRSDDELPSNVQGVVIRADGKQIVTDWVPVSVIEAKSSDEITAESGVAMAVDSIAEPSNVEAVTCPNCGAPLTNTVIASLTVCPKCGRTIALADGTATIALSSHTVGLPADTIKALKQLRPRR